MAKRIPKVHFQHPVFSYHACGIGDPLSVEIANDLAQVTCERCLATATAQKRLPGRPLKGQEPTKKVSIRFPKSLLKWVDSLDGERTANIVRLISAAKEEWENKTP